MPWDSTRSTWLRSPAVARDPSPLGSEFVYAPVAFGSRCRDAGARQDMGSIGDCFDDAMRESFFTTLKCELLARHKSHSQAQAMPILCEFIEGWCNILRRHSVLGQIAPLEFERKHAPRSEAFEPRSGLQGSPRIDDHIPAWVRSRGAARRKHAGRGS